MNTINNPLIIEKRLSNWTYGANKPWDQSGSYVDLALAEEMLDVINAQKLIISELLAGKSIVNLSEILSEINNSILKAKG